MALAAVPPDKFASPPCCYTECKELKQRCCPLNAINAHVMFISWNVMTKNAFLTKNTNDSSLNSHTTFVPPILNSEQVDQFLRTLESTGCQRRILKRRCLQFTSISNSKMADARIFLTNIIPAAHIFGFWHDVWVALDKKYKFCTRMFLLNAK